MKKYRVVVTKQAQSDLRKKLAYIQTHLKNPQAAQNVYNDYKLTRSTLEEVAGTIREPDSDTLKARNLRNR